MSMNKLFTVLIILLNLYHICGELFTSTYLLTESKVSAVNLVKLIDSYLNEDNQHDDKLNTDRLSKDTDQNDNTCTQNEKCIVKELKRYVSIVLRIHSIHIKVKYECILRRIRGISFGIFASQQFHALFSCAWSD